MERGAIWLPLLALFVWLTRAGWNEYRKVEAYRLWAEGFERSKYDIYAALGQQQSNLTWGKPAREGIIEPQSVSLTQINEINLSINDRIVALDNLPSKGKPTIVLKSIDDDREYLIPFTDINLAAKWTEFLQKEIAVLKHE